MHGVGTVDPSVVAPCPRGSKASMGRVAMARSDRGPSRSGKMRLPIGTRAGPRAATSGICDATAGLVATWRQISTSQRRDLPILAAVRPRSSVSASKWQGSTGCGPPWSSPRRDLPSSGNRPAGGPLREGMQWRWRLAPAGPTSCGAWRRRAFLPLFIARAKAGALAISAEAPAATGPRLSATATTAMRLRRATRRAPSHPQRTPGRCYCCALTPSPTGQATPVPWSGQ